jgi:pilus assembly protein CpaF
VSELVDYAVIRKLQSHVADLQLSDRRLLQASGQPPRTQADEQQQAHSFIRQVVSQHLQQMLANRQELPADPAFEMRLRAAIFSAIYGAGELQELLDNELVENIDINGCEQTWVTYAGGIKELWRPVAASNEDLISIVQNLGSYAGMNARPFSTATPELDVRLQDGSRLSAVMSATETPSVSIRRNRYPQMFLPTLVALGCLDERLATFLQAAVLARMNIMVAGATNAGKTTLLRAMINVISADERLITVEKALELGLRRHPDLHPNVVEWEMVLPDAEDRGGISMAALVQRSLRQNPSRVIVGEVLGEEIVVMLNAMSQGNDGSLSTIHARNSVAVLDRIASYAAQAENLSFEVTHSLIAGAIDFIVFIRQNPYLGGLRTVAEVLEVSGFDGERVTHSDVFVPSDIDGRAVRSDYAISDARLKRLEAEGYNDRGFFGAL